MWEFSFLWSSNPNVQKERSGTETESKVILGAENTKIFESTILNMVDIFSEKSEKNAIKQSRRKKIFCASENL